MAVIMGLETKFNEVAAEYDQVRPTYVPELYRDIQTYKAIRPDSKALEIGIGTGQATLPVLQTGCTLTAVELGDNLAAFVREKFKDYPNFNVVNRSFQDFQAPDQSFDLIYSASAFHWIPEEIGYPKVFRLLKSGGIFARFANRPYWDRENPALHDAIQRVYAKYMPNSAEGPEFSEEKCRELAGKLTQNGFEDVEYHLYHRIRTFDALGYTTLLSTYSDHRALPEEMRNRFLSEIKEQINAFGGKIRMFDTIDLQLGWKP